MESIQLKTCSKCRIEKLISEFWKKANRPDGLRSACIDCEKADAEIWRKANPDYQKNHYQENKEQILARMKRRRIAHPEFHRTASKHYAEKNKEKIAKMNSDWVRNNPEKNRTKRARRRASELAAKGYVVTPKEMGELYRRNCIYCGSMEKIEIDHVIPLSRGGNHSIGNLVPSCQYCNRSKGSKTIMEWRVSHS